MLIRRATPLDTSNIAFVESTCFSEPWSDDLVTNDILDGKIYLVAETKGSVVGYVSAYNIVDEVQIMRVAVLPEYRGTGVAYDLISELIKLSVEADMYSITLEVRESNVPAIRLYEKCGFKYSGTRPGYYSNGEGAKIYWLTIKE